jgi:hypothetical protein
VISFAMIFLALSGLFLIFQRQTVTDLQKMAIGGRLPAGCVVAQGVLLLLAALVIAILYWTDRLR